MELSRKVSGRDVESLALEKLEIQQERIKDLRDSRRDDIEMFKFDVLCLWRNKSVDNTKQVMQTLNRYFHNYSSKICVVNRNSIGIPEKFYTPKLLIQYDFIMQKLFEIMLEVAAKYGNLNSDSIRCILERDCLVK